MQYDPAPFSLRLFGPFEARLNGRPLPRLRSLKGQWLLALLVLRHPAEVERSWLAGLLWPDSDEPQALANLRNSLTDLRRALGPEADRLRSPGVHTLSLDLAGAEVDVTAFDAAMARRTPEALEEAVALYRGPLMEGCAEEWAFQERQVREGAYLAALERLAQAARERQEYAAAERHLRRAVAVDATRETAQRALMAVLAESGNYAAAIQVYRELREYLHRELNAEPDGETKALFEAIRAEARRRASEGARERGSARVVLGEESALAEERQDRERTLAPSLPRSLAPSIAGGEDTVTFLFTDIEGSTRLWEEHPDAMRLALERHDVFLRNAIETNNGRVFKTVGDAFYAAFATPSEAVDAALAAQRHFLQATRSTLDSQLPLKVRIALHTGAAEEREGDYFGPALNRVARLLEAAHGGQVLLTGATQALVQDDLPPGATLRELGLHRLRDLQRPEQVYQLVHPDLPAEFGPLATLNTLPNNLPQQVTSFVGRERELAELKELLGAVVGRGVKVEGSAGGRGEGAGPHTPVLPAPPPLPPRPLTHDPRLITITGVGGTGKTRLALQVAAELLESWSDGVWLVELAPLSEPGLVPQAVATALGLRERPDRPLRQTLVETLKERKLLLVLDNCEHVLAACAELALTLLRGCPGVRILATSREALNIPGEMIYRLRSLAVPEPNSWSMVDGQWLMTDDQSRPDQPSTINHPPSTLLQYEAVRLFVDRARAALPSFTVTEQNIPAIAQVCHRLDGIPLAIELAAARVKALPVEKISERLDDRFRLLTGGSRTAPPRQQTLRSLIDWSYDLLSEPERILLRRLSVFRGGWTLEAAEAVCSDDQRRTTNDQRMGQTVGTDVGRWSFVVGRDDVLDLLTALVDKSLVQYEAPGGEGRYRLLETVRQYGEERLREAGEIESVRDQHLEWCLQVAERAEPELLGPDLFAVLEELDAEHDNLRAALDWSRERAPAKGLQLAGALWIYWSIRAHVSEARTRLTSFLERAECGEPTPARARALTGAAGLAYFQGDFARMGALAEEALAVARAAGDPRHVSMALFFLGVAQQFYRGDYERATALYEESIAIARELGVQWLIAICVDVLGFAALRRGEAARAEALLEESLELMRQVGNKWLITFPLKNLGIHAFHRGDYARANALCREALALHAKLGSKWGIGIALEILAGVAAAQGEPARAARLLGAAEALRHDFGISLSEDLQPDHDRVVATIRADLGEAVLTAEWAAGRALRLEQAVAYALGGGE